MFPIRLFIIEGKEISKEGITPEDLTAVKFQAEINKTLVLNLDHI